MPCRARAWIVRGFVMTPANFRRMALEMHGASEGAHMSHPDFRVGGRIFATLGYPNEDFAVVVLTPEDQQIFVCLAPRAFAPVKGGWGRRGGTQVTLAAVKPPILRKAIKAAWETRAAKRALKPRSRSRKRATAP
jgi:hypothetical protein